jgi:hypothetical protein
LEAVEMQGLLIHTLQQVQRDQIQHFQQLHRQVVELVILQELVEVILLEDLEVD